MHDFKVNGAKWEDEEEEAGSLLPTRSSAFASPPPICWTAKDSGFAASACYSPEKWHSLMVVSLPSKIKLP